MAQMLENIWKTEELPEYWTSALIHPLHKNGDRTDVNNYRGISLLPVIYLDKQLGQYQRQFRKGRSCAEHILNLKIIIAYQKRRSRNYIITFDDVKKAYDSVDKTTLIGIFKELGLDNKTRAIIQQILNQP